MEKQNQNNTKKGIFSSVSTRRGTYLALVVIIAIVVAIMANVIVRKLPQQLTRIDLSGTEMFTFTQQTKDICKNLTDDVTLYYISNADQGHSDLSKYVEQLITRYESLSKHIKVVKVDPAQNPTFVAQYTTDAVTDKSVIVDGPNRAKVVDFYDIFVYDESLYMSSGEVDMDFKGEPAITSAISYVISDNVPVLYVTMGHSEVIPDDSILERIWSEGYTTVEVSLATLDAIPEEADCLLIDCPQIDITDRELQIINEYLSRGGNLFFISSYVDDSMPNLQSLMAQFSMYPVSGMVVEGNTSYYFSGRTYFIMPETLYHTSTAPMYQNALRVMTRQVQGIEIDQVGSADNVKVVELLRTSSQSYSKVYEGSVENLTTLEKTDADIAGPFAIGAAATVANANGTESRVIWLSGSDFNSAEADAYVSGANRDMVINSLAYLCDWEQTISIRSTDVETVKLAPSTIQMIVWGAVYPGLVVIVVLLIGAIVWLRRRTR
ncbi:MAG: GldG family protein [Clostridia bacterium]|nr:GldG family protein [Clostridia bacterium]